MLNWPGELGYPKPETYDREFAGTAMQALEAHLIPFPYKVAKALDPEMYRNLEYDVWIKEKRAMRARSRSLSLGRRESPAR